MVTQMQRRHWLQLSGRPIRKKRFRKRFSEFLDFFRPERFLCVFFISFWFSMRFLNDLRFHSVFFAFPSPSDTQITFPKIRCVSETFFAYRKRKSRFLKFRRGRQGRLPIRNLRFRSVSGNVPENAVGNAKSVSET